MPEIVTPCFYWSPWRDLNPRPTDYESVALPLSYIGCIDDTRYTIGDSRNRIAHTE